MTTYGISAEVCADKTLVIARYGEDLSWIGNINCQYLIYNKGLPLNIPSIPTANIGRESETYLRYIKDNYHNLPNIVIFAQGNPFDHCADFINKVNSIELLDADYITLCDATYSINIDTAQPYLKEVTEKFIPEYSNVHKGWDFGAGAQYAVSKKLILKKPIDWWEHLYNTHIHYSTLNSDSQLNIPHVFERLWPIIWTK
jgi:hypothetical protein